MIKGRSPKAFNPRTLTRLERRPSSEFRPASKVELKRMGFSIGSERLVEKSAKRVSKNTPSISRREYLKKRGWYDLITATFDENWIDDDLDGSDTEI